MAKPSVDLLSSIPTPKTTWEKLFDWTFKAGRYIIVAVEAVVLIAFGTRFVMDRIRNELEDRIATSVNQIQGLEVTGQIDNVVLTHTQLETAAVVLDDRRNISQAYSDIEALLTDGVEVTAFTIQDQKFTISGNSASLNSIQSMEENFKNSSNFSQITLNINDVDGQTNFSLEGQLLDEVYVGISDDSETANTNTQ